MSLDTIHYAHPTLHAAWPILQERLKKQGIDSKLGSVHRTPAEQFALFKKGRVSNGGHWVPDTDPKTSTVTTRDGYDRPSHHNLLPTGAIDVNLFRDGKYLTSFTDYEPIGVIARELGLEWGGNWKSLRDGPHVQLFDSACLGGSIRREVGAQWQRYLVKAGRDVGVVDGYPGAKTLAALKLETGHDALTPEAWRALYDKYGAL